MYIINHHVVHFKDIKISFAHCTSIKLRKKITDQICMGVFFNSPFYSIDLPNFLAKLTIIFGVQIKALI